MPSNSTPPHPPTANILALEPGERRRPGRPRAITRAPDEFERARHRRVQERLEKFIGDDAVVIASYGDADRDSTARLDAAMLALAQESAALLWSRRQAQLYR